MDTPSLIKALGVSLPSPAYLTGAIAFGLVGMAAYAHGKRVERRQTQWIGVALMLFPYAISTTWLMYAVGAILCAGLLVNRE
ncbi:MAG TPA: hypothetical protein PLD78_00820 [Burkholderiaceae bacterium]|jgi:uncharacterized membrane protein|nr:hypothetical protein [Burkholderiaceae bacterium]